VTRVCVHRRAARARGTRPGFHEHQKATRIYHRRRDSQHARRALSFVERSRRARPRPRGGLSLARVYAVYRAPRSTHDSRDSTAILRLRLRATLDFGTFSAHLRLPQHEAKYSMTHAHAYAHDDIDSGRHSAGRWSDADGGGRRPLTAHNPVHTRGTSCQSSSSRPMWSATT
jgi:hypothetical protein